MTVYSRQDARADAPRRPEGGRPAQGRGDLLLVTRELSQRLKRLVARIQPSLYLPSRDRFNAPRTAQFRLAIGPLRMTLYVRDVLKRIAEQVLLKLAVSARIGAVHHGPGIGQVLCKGCRELLNGRIRRWSGGRGPGRGRGRTWGRRGGRRASRPRQQKRQKRNDEPRRQPGYQYAGSAGQVWPEAGSTSRTMSAAVPHCSSILYATASRDAKDVSDVPDPSSLA